MLLLKWTNLFYLWEEIGNMDEFCKGKDKQTPNYLKKKSLDRQSRIHILTWDGGKNDEDVAFFCSNIILYDSRSLKPTFAATRLTVKPRSELDCDRN